VACEDFDDFMKYLEREASAGDAMDVWSLESVGTKQNRLVYGKCPDDRARIPWKGAY
jgi:hypothetical protein